MNTDLEPVLQAFLSYVAGAVSVNFTGSFVDGSQTITGVTGGPVGYEGVGLVGPGVPLGTTIVAMNKAAGTITVDQNLQGPQSNVAFTAGFLTIGRRLKFWDDPSISMPALFIRHTGDQDEFGDGIYGTTTAAIELWIYSKAGEDPNLPPDTALNRLVKVIRNSLKADSPMTGRFTLGGLCHWCRIEGESSYDDGAIDKYSKAKLPIRITLP